MLSLGVGVWASWAALMWLLADAHRTDFDPRPALRRAFESGRYDRLLIAVGPVKHDAFRTATRARTALLALLLPTTETTS